jgi:hypothetical protein
MNRAPFRDEAEAAILARMAASRAALLEANRTTAGVSAARRQTSLPATFVSAIAETPRVATLLALGVGAIILGPRRTLAIAGRSGAAAWVGSSVRRLFSRPNGQVGVDK